MVLLFGDLIPREDFNSYLLHRQVSHRDAIIRIFEACSWQRLVYLNCGHGHTTSFLDTDWPGSPIDSTVGYCVFVGGNLVSWKNKKRF